MNDWMVDDKNRYARELDAQFLVELFQPCLSKPFDDTQCETHRDQHTGDDHSGHCAIFFANRPIAHNPTMLSSTPLTLMVSWVARWLLSESWMKFSVPPIDDEHEPQAPWYCT